MENTKVTSLNTKSFEGKDGGIRIALDLDGVLADSISVWVSIWNSISMNRISIDDIKEWDFWRYLGITEREFHRIFYLAWKNWRMIPPTEKDLAYKVSLLDTLGEVDIVSARPRNTIRFVMMWLREHGLSDRRFVSVKPKFKKHELDYDFFIDDSPINAIEIASSGKYVILYDRPWNRKIANSEKIKRVYNLLEAYDLIKRSLNR